MGTTKVIDTLTTLGTVMMTLIIVVEKKIAQFHQSAGV